MYYDKMTDDQLAWVMAEKRGCACKMWGGIPCCPCPGMPHGVHIQGYPPRLHKFPRDVMIGFLKSKEPVKDFDPYKDCTTVCRFVVDKLGCVNFDYFTPHALQHYAFALMMRGAAQEMDDYYARKATQYSKVKTNVEPDNGIDELLGGEDGVGQPGS